MYYEKCSQRIEMANGPLVENDKKYYELKKKIINKPRKN